ncbi:hypothetical protein ACHAWC_001834, partial [Mediolabrus comicus]
MSSLALAMNRGGGGGGDIRRQRSTGGNSTTQRRRMSSSNGRSSTPTRYANQMDRGGARMDFSPSNSNTNRRKSYTQTHLQRQPKKSKSRKERVTSAPSKMMFYTTSARKDTSLARNRFKRFGGGGVSDVRSDYGTTRNNQDSSRDRAADDDHPHIVTIGTKDKEGGGEVADFVDEIGDAILEANESMWKLIFHNDAMAKVIFPVEGNGEVEGDDDSLGDGGTIRQATSVDYFMNCTQTTFDGSAVEMTNSMHEAAARTSDAPKKKSGGLLGMRRKKTKSNNRQGSTKVLDAIAEGGELGGVAEARQEEDGVSAAGSAGSDGLVRESMALLTIYNKSIDGDEEEKDQEVNEKEENENEDEQMQEVQEEGVEAVTAFALCGDENAIVSSDQQEMTLQEVQEEGVEAVTAFALVGDENTIVSSDQQEVTLQEFTGEKALATKNVPSSSSARKSRKKLLDVNAILCQNPEHVLDDDYTGFTSDASSTSSSSTTFVTEKASLKDGGGNGSVSKWSQSSKKGKGGVIEDTFEPEKELVGVPTLDMNVTSFDMLSQKNDDIISTISMQTDLKSRAANTCGLGYGRSLLNALTGYTGENVEGESRVTEETIEECDTD